MDNPPNDPSNPNSNNNSTPPPFGSGFTPHTNPVDPNNPYQSQPPQIPVTQPPQPSVSIPTAPEDPPSSTYSEVAQHKLRDSHGRFATDHISDEQNPKPDVPKENFLKCAFIWISKIKWTKVTLYFVSFGAFLALLISHPGFKNLVNQLFPNSSPIFAREVSMQGILKSSSEGLYTLVLPDQQAYSLRFKPSASLANIKKLNEVVVKGHLGWTPFVIEDAEIYPLNFTIPNDDTNSSPKSQNSLTNPTTPNSPNTPDSASLPTLFSGLTWEVTKTKTLIFTSGMRKIEQEGVYLESAQVPNFPQDFINYYTNQLINSGFKQTLNSSEPTGTTITFAKDDLFLTFGVKNIYSGSGDNKKLIGYKAFIEHN